MKIFLILSWIALVIVIILSNNNKKKKVSKIIDSPFNISFTDGISSKLIIDNNKFENNFYAKIKEYFYNFLSVLNPEPTKKLILFFLVTIISVYFVNDYFFKKDFFWCLLLFEPILFVVFLMKLNQMRTKKFKNNFPDALNLLTGAVSSGQSVMHAFEYVGEQLDNEIGTEFKIMAERLLIGESPDDVLKRSSYSFPYTEYFFFISAIRINLERGGQLKEVLSKINKLMFMSRSIEKKRDALTSEARASAKIVACLPVIFLAILRFFSPENYNFVMFEDAGKPIFYYVIVSEMIGFICIWFILRGVD
ncbi:type II secretion system F family protein [Vibrio parahaemolyticus]|uniref:type II secretion system F family protein n=1 Tax=Vibrio parahaemolyticus TaxID=670 RepID=UPI003891FAA0